MLKKHWGILLCAVIFLAALTLMLIKTLDLSKQYKESVADLDSQRQWFATLNNDGWRVTKAANGELENVLIAEQNRDLAVGHYNSLKKELYQRFSFEPQIPPNATRAAEELDRRLSQLTDTALVTYKMDFGDEIGGKLAEINSSDQELSTEDFKPIFRQLMIYEMMVQHLGRAGVKVVNALDFPRSLTPEEDGDHTITPVVIDFEGDSKTVQTLLNNLTNDRHMLFIIRNISFDAVSAEQPAMEFTQVALLRRQMLDAKKAEMLNGRSGVTDGFSRSDRNDTSTRANRRSSRKNDSAMDAKSTRGSSRKSRKKDDSGVGSTRLGRGASGYGLDGGIAGLLNIDENLLHYEDPKRQDNLVFRTPRTLSVELTLDLIEMNPPEEESESTEGETPSEE
ncbi:MAG: hypothetical protein MJ106_03015 [Lentisphaeria bacterium]|nr:hypothetical protein [Lentisphaeria bacterium]